MRKLIFSAAVCCAINAAVSCTCGSFAGGSYYGIMPQYHKNVAGLRWFHRSFESVPIDESERTSSEIFNTVEAWGRFYPVKRIQLLAFIPFNFNATDDGSKQSVSGFGDISLSANYTVVNTSDSCERKWRHLLLAGAGIKLPAGRYKVKDDNGDINPYLQPGTGSVDFTFYSVYSIRFKKFGMQADAEYRSNTKNKQGYKFGNTFTGSAKLFYWQAAGKLIFLPNAGISFLSAMKDDEFGFELSNTGGNELLATFGLDVYFRRFMTGFTYKHPAYQNLAEGTVSTRNKWLANVAYLF